METYKSKGPVYQLGAFNARVQRQNDPTEFGIGPNTFYNQKITFHDQSEAVETNRRLFLEHLQNISYSSKCIFWKKKTTDEQLATYHGPTPNDISPPFERGLYETLDYVLVQNRWTIQHEIAKVIIKRAMNRITFL